MNPQQLQGYYNYYNVLQESKVKHQEHHAQLKVEDYKKRDTSQNRKTYKFNPQFIKIFQKNRWLDSFQKFTFRQQINEKQIKELKELDQRKDMFNAAKIQVSQNRIIFQDAKVFHRGIRNSGNTCYVNCVLQCLHKSHHFITQFQKCYRRPQNSKFLQQKLQISPFIDQIISQLSKQAEPLDASSIRKIVQMTNPIFNSYSQNDAIQFLASLLDCLNSQLDTSPQEKIFKSIEHIINQKERELQIHKIYQETKSNDEMRCKSICDQTFTGRYKVTYRCLNQQCKKDYILFEKFNFHYIDLCQFEDKAHNTYCEVKQTVNLKNFLQNFKRKEKLEGDNQMICDSCGQLTDTQKSMQIYQANSIFTVCFKRFLKGQKRNTLVEIPYELELNDVMLDTKNQENKVYRLYGAIIHVGSLQGGHYTAKCFNYKSGKWVKYNDQSYSEIDGLPDLCNAYAVFYGLQEKQLQANSLNSKQQSGGNNISSPLDCLV